MSLTVVAAAGEQRGCKLEFENPSWEEPEKGVPIAPDEWERMPFLECYWLGLEEGHNLPLVLDTGPSLESFSEKQPGVVLVPPV